MDPQEWQRLADEIAAEATESLDQIEAEFWPEPADPTFRSFWPRIRALSERLRTAPAIDIEVKLRLQNRVRELSRKARDRQEVYFEGARARKQELLDQVEALRAKAASASQPQVMRQLRQEIAAFRDQFANVDLPTRGDRQELWNTWQKVNQEAWDRLTALWEANEAALQAILDRAQSRLDVGDVKGARDVIKEFNTVAREKEASHKSARTLRNRANEIWRNAGEVAQAKHEAFMATAGTRVEQWKQVEGRNSRAINKLRAEVAELRSRGGETDLAAAFTRALIEEKMREIAKLEETNDSLHHRIERTASALTPVG